MSLTITHTSPSLITEINKFGGCASNGTMFFSVNDYAMGNVAAIYDMNIDESEIVKVSDLCSESIVLDIANYFDCDKDLAESLLDGSENEWDQAFDCEGDDSWWLQGAQAECAEKMGFVACESEDENGVVYMIKMNNELLNKMELRK